MSLSKQDYENIQRMIDESRRGLVTVMDLDAVEDSLQTDIAGLEGDVEALETRVDNLESEVA